MNYHLTLVSGEGAGFFLEDWKPGGVGITDDVVGLFEALRQEEELAAALDLYRLQRVRFDQAALLRIGLSRTWTWRRIGWEGRGPGARQVMDRIADLLRDGFPDDRERRVRLLKVVQAAAREFGPPAFVEGLFTRPHGREDRVAVYASGSVRYDTTPHPLPLLIEIAGQVR